MDIECQEKKQEADDWVKKKCDTNSMSQTCKKTSLSMITNQWLDQLLFGKTKDRLNDWQGGQNVKFSTQWSWV